ncbi:MAG TPA: CPBP family intramembrane glutamic endopeptidase [Candidatus Nitrosotalea sp.]|nr:CPBP family intramembrane glutamic endopeptidase [Candidatus Nitrosotalea sp.]
MVRIDKIIRVISVPYSAFISVVFGIMVISFPVGAYLIFDSEIGNSINYQYPVDKFSFFIAGIGYNFPVSFQLGDAFIVAWSAYLVLFSLAFAGPFGSFTRTLTGIMSEGFRDMRENGLVGMITWFSILVFSSVAIDFIQGGLGVTMSPPPFQNGLIQFFQMTVSPLTEEIGFRVLLVGVPLFLIFSHRASWRLFFKSLWSPSGHLQITDYKKTMAIVITVGVFFGAAHIISGTPWSPGKITQASLAGIIIGWVYVRYGLAPAILVHWGTNYFIYSYLYFISAVGHVPLSSDTLNPFSNMLEQLLMVTGGLAVALILLRRAKEKVDRVSSSALREARSEKGIGERFGDW